MLGFDEFVDQPSRRCESNAFLLTASRHAQCRGQVGFSGSAFSNQNHGLGTTDIAAIGQLTNPVWKPARRAHTGEDGDPEPFGEAFCAAMVVWIGVGQRNGADLAGVAGRSQGRPR